MNKKLYVGNLPFTADENGLRDAFGADGRQVSSVKIMMDRETGRSRGFAFVEMATPEDAQKAIQAMHGQQFMGRPLTVNEARDQPPRVGGFGGAPGAGAGPAVRPNGSFGAPPSGGSGGSAVRPNGSVGGAPLGGGPRPGGFSGGGPRPVGGGGGFSGPRPGGGFPPPVGAPGFEPPAEERGRANRDKGKDRDRARRGRGEDWD